MLFIQAILAYGRAIQLTVRLRLWGYVFVPGFISLLIGALIFGSAWGLSDNIGDWLVARYPFEWGKAAMESIGAFLGGLLVIALGLIVFKHLVMALASPFMSFLSEKIDRKLTGRKTDISFSFRQVLRDLGRGFTIAFRNILRELFYTLLLFFLGLIPVLTPFTTLMIFIVQAYYTGFGNMDYTLERYFNVRDSIRFVKDHRWLAVGNGTVFLLLLFTVVGFLFALPLGTIAATSEVVRRLEGYTDLH